MNPNPTDAYIGRKKCGCVTSVTIDYGGEDVVDIISEILDDGKTVEKVTIEESRKLLQKCSHGNEAIK